MLTRLLTTAALVAVPLAVAPSAQADPTTPQTIAVTAGAHGAFTVTGPTTLRAGRVTLTLTTSRSAPGGGFALSSFSDGYALKDLVAAQKYGATHVDAQGNPTPAALRKFRKVATHTTFRGGAGLAGGGESTTTTVLLEPGTYTLYDEGASLPSHPIELTVVAPQLPDVPPTADTSVRFKNMRFHGDKVLPRSGTMALTNADDDQVHFLALARVKPGTTRADVRRGFKTGDQSFFLGEMFESEALSPGQSETFSYPKQRPGEYLEVCFFPDLKTGVPHAYMGMFKLVTIR